MTSGSGVERRPVCLVLGEGVTALGVIRSLGRARIPLVAANNQGDISSWSRWNVAGPVDLDATADPGALAAWLSALSMGEGVLMPCSDGWAKAVAQLDSPAKRGFHTWGPGADVVDRLVNKDRFRAQLESLQLPHPRTFALDRPDALQSVPPEVFERAFLKPHESQSFFAEYGVKGLFVSSEAEALDKLGSVNDKGFSAVLQEYIPGPATAHFFIDGYRPRGSTAMRLLARRRLRMYPADFGNSTDMVTVSLDDVKPAVATLETLFDSLGYHGIFSAEFKYDARDEEFKLIEVNCRPWWYVEYADRCGLHVCSYAYQDALDLPLDPYVSFAINKRCVYPLFDWAARQENIKSNVREQGMISMLTTWIFGYQPIFSWSDPVPAIKNFVLHVKSAVSTRIPWKSASLRS